MRDLAASFSARSAIWRAYWPCDWPGQIDNRRQLRRNALPKSGYVPVLDAGQSDMFRARLDQIIDRRHEKAVLRARSAGGIWRSGLANATALSPAIRRCRRG